MDVHPIRDGDRARLRTELESRWGSTRVVSRGRLHEAADLPGWLAADGEEPLGYLTFRVEAGDMEIVTLDALRPREGIGRRLVEVALAEARVRGLCRAWLITTNDNVPAQAFYEAVGFERVAVYEGAMARSRLLKPEIPETGIGGVPIRDEIEYAWKTAP